MREWHGVTHEVRVLDRGVLYKRKRYRSLSEVAGVISGAHWNGPQFFGLRAGETRRRVMARSDCAPKRCAIYTRKSSEEGLDQNFNSLHAQGQACEALLNSQAGEGWRSITIALRPFIRAAIATASPAGPPPATSTSQSRAEVIVTKMSAKTICLKGPGTEHPRLRRFDPAT